MPAPNHTRSPRLGYALAATAATLWALNGSLARFLLDDHMPAARLAELRSLGAFLVVVAAVGLMRPRLLKVDRADLGRLALFGIVGLAGVQAFYFAAIARLDIGVALTIQYLGPLLLLVWLKLVHRRALPSGLWSAAALSSAGCFLVVGAYDPSGLNGVGILAAFGSTVTFAVYLFAGERLGRRYQPATTLAWGLGLSSAFWLVTQPLWTFPWHILDSPRNAAYAAYVVIGGTLVPFGCMIAATRHIPAARAGVVATLEPVLGALLAWPIHDQRLAPPQIIGGLLVVGAVVWVQSQRPALEAELAPAYGDRTTKPPATRPAARVE
jgi:drug/metabolite transporter (DMT)-like permease